MRLTIRKKLLFLLLPVIVLVISISIVSIIIINSQHLKNRTFSRISELTERLASEFDAILQKNIAIVSSLAEMMEKNKTHDRQEVMDMLEALLKENPQIVGIDVGYEPNAFDGKDFFFRNTRGHDSTGRFLPYWHRLKGKDTLEPMMDIDKSDWYNIPKRTKSLSIIEPFIYDNVLMTSFVYPILDKDSNFIGIAGLDISLAQMDSLTKNVKVLESGHVQIISSSGIYVAHPDKSRIGTTRITDDARMSGDTTLSFIYSQIKNKKSGVVLSKNSITGEEAYLFYTPIKTANWGLIAVAPEKEIFVLVRKVSWTLFFIGLFSLILVVAIILVVSYQISKPILELTQVAEEISNGHLNVSIKNYKGELGVLAATLEKMVCSLRKFQNEMEALVRERTKELQETNEKLKGEIEVRNYMERELRAAKEAAENATRAKSEFLANMSHEIRTPLNAIIGFSNLALKDENLPEKTSDYLKKIDNAGKTLLAIINDILDFSKIEAGKIEISRNIISLTNILKEAYSMFLPVARQKNIEITLFQDENIPKYVKGDGLRIMQVLINLVSNAVKYTDKGEVRIETRISEDAAGRYKLECSVCDTGVGISSEMLSAIFKPFEQVDCSLSRRQGGTGLGLTITKKLVELMEGEISVQSTLGKGSVFSFYVMLDKPSEDELSSVNENMTKITYTLENLALVEKIKGASVLLVEDNEINRQVATEILKHLGVMVYSVGSGFEALKVLESLNFDAILLDLQLPGIDGYETATEIRRRFTKDIPIIALTGHALPAFKEKSILAGMNDFLTKPIVESELIRVLSKYINIQGKSISITDPESVFQSAKYPIINIQEGISRLSGNKELYFKLLSEFEEKYSLGFHDIISDCKDNKTQNFRDYVHTIKGIAANLSFTRLYNTCLALEKALDDNSDKIIISTLCSSFEAHLKEVFNEIDALKRKAELGL